jgi:cold shock CspA family protein
MTTALIPPRTSPSTLDGPPATAAASPATIRWRHGTVLWFDEPKGFGFVAPADGGANVFVRHSAIDVPGYRTLSAGQPVLFITHETEDELEATLVRPGCSNRAEALEARVRPR